MRHYRIPVAIAVGAVAAIAAVGTGVAKTTPAVSAKPAQTQSAAALMAAHRGGTLKLLAKAAGGSLDPQVNYTLEYWQLYRFTQDGLVTFKAAGGDEAFKIVPDLAVAIPKPTDGGKTWTFQLRKGIKFSNGKEFQPRDVLYSFERIFKVHTPTAGGFYSVLVGADKCLKTPATCTSRRRSWSTRRSWTVTFHLSAPDAEWLDKLAVPHAAMLPYGTPNKDLGTKLPPGTGAYTFTKYDPNHELLLARNPYFKEWSADAQPEGYVDKIEYTFGQTVEAQITQIENGKADWTLESPPADRLNEIGTKYAEQAHINTLIANWYLPMNVNLPPFNNKLARQAVNYAVDRNAAVRIFGGPKLAVPGCQVLPAGFPARVDYCPYTKNPGAKWTAPDLAKAKALVEAVGHRRAEGRDRRLRTTRSTRPWASTSRACSTRSATRRRSRRSPATSSSPTSRTRTTRSRSASRSGTRTIRRRRTSSTCCSAARRSTPAATPASTSRASATRRSTPR